MSIKLSHSSHETIDLTRLRWRFVICTASFYVNAISWGFISSTGIFEDAFKNTFQLSSFRSTLPGSILFIKYGVRWTLIFGAFICTIRSILTVIIGLVVHSTDY